MKKILILLLLVSCAYNNTEIKVPEEFLAAVEPERTDVDMYFNKGVNALKASDYEDAEFYFLKSAEKGSVKSQELLGYMYANGLPTESTAKSVYWYEKAALQNSVYAQRQLGEYHYNQKNYYNSFTWYLKAAESGDTHSQYYMGLMCENGYGTEKNLKNAASWYIKAAIHNADAQYKLAKMYETGTGVKKKVDTSVKYYIKSADSGHDKAQFELGKYNFFKNNDAKLAAAWLIKSAAQNNRDAKLMLGMMYLDGTGVEQNDQKALDLLKEVADAGFPEALYALAVLYSGGRVVEKDESKTLELYLLSAERGYPKAQNNLGYMYQTGTGVAKDLSLSKKWYLAAAAQNDNTAQFNLGTLEYSLSNYKEAAKWYKASAGNDNIQAMYNLGAMYHLGQGLSKDYKNAKKWYNKSAEFGYEPAMEMYGVILISGKAGKADYNNGCAWIYASNQKNHENVCNKKIKTASQKKNVQNKIQLINDAIAKNLLSRKVEI